MDRLQLNLKSDKLVGELAISGSKSISNRVLIMNALADADGQFTNLSTSGDTQLMLRVLEQIKTCAHSRIPLVVDARNAGTVYRFLTAYLAVSNGLWLLTGDDRMKQRPIHPLVDGLRSLGAELHYASHENYPPLRIKGKQFNGGEVNIDPSMSSQFASALMMIGLYLKGGLKIRFKSKPVSEPYLKMTANIMQEFGADVRWSGNQVEISKGEYKVENYHIEPDWSSASYWYEMAALSREANLLLTGFTKESVQGDQICAKLFERLGVKTIFEKKGIRLIRNQEMTKFFEYDFSDIPDLVPAIAVTCALKGIPSKFSGVEHLRIKESDRVLSLKNELQKIDAQLVETDYGFELMPCKTGFKQRKLTFDTHNDHRIAMSFAPLFFKFGSVTINDPSTVNKSYPSFWEHIQQLGPATVEKI